MIYDQATNLRRQVHSDHHAKEAKAISIVSGKGGVGKSNFAINFSLALIKQNKKVLLIDLDIGMGNIDILLGLQAEYTIIDVLNDRLSIQDMIETGPLGLSYIAGGSSLTEFFQLNREKMDYFLSQYHELAQLYDYIIFDIGAGVSTDSLFFILSSDECIVITTPEPTAITDAYSMIKHITNRRHLPVHVVLNRCLNMKSGKQTLVRFQNVVSQFLNINIHSLGMIPEDKTVLKAVMRQTPYLLFNAKAPVSVAVEQIARLYVTQLYEPNQRKPFSFIQRFKSVFKKGG